jgi:hypothetical protein
MLFRMTRFEFRQTMAKDTGAEAAGGSLAAFKSQFPSLLNPNKGKDGKTTEKKAPDNRIIVGGSEHKLLLLLKRQKGEMTVEELAPLVETRSGVGTEVDTLRSQISKLRGKLERMKMPQDQIDAIMPKDYGTGGRGRRAGVAFDTDAIAALLGADDDTFAEALAESEGDEGETAEGNE